jgi:superfamily I DNA/RNA helicase
MTRAKIGLFFSWAQDYGGARKKKSSRFLQELGLVKPETKKKKETYERQSAHYHQNPSCRKK